MRRVAMNASISRRGGCAIAVMAKTPRPGLVKTRLVPPLSPSAASALSASFLRDITENIALAARAADIHGYVAYAPVGLEAAFEGTLASGTRLVLADGAGISIPGVYGFGRSLLQAAQTLFARGHHAVCVIAIGPPDWSSAISVGPPQGNCSRLDPAICVLDPAIDKKVPAEERDSAALLSPAARARLLAHRIHDEGGFRVAEVA